jgi:hypothetical protein
MLIGRIKIKIGLSYSRCVRDILEGKVDINDVLVIIARTNFDPHNDEEWNAIWVGYTRSRGFSHAEWSNYKEADNERFRELTIELYDTGRIHQPRKFGIPQHRRREIWLETVLPETELDRNPAVKEAWEKFQVLAQLADVKLRKDYL